MGELPGTVEASNLNCDAGSLLMAWKPPRTSWLRTATRACCWRKGVLCAASFVRRELVAFRKQLRQSTGLAKPPDRCRLYRKGLQTRPVSCPLEVRTETPLLPLS